MYAVRPEWCCVCDKKAMCAVAVTGFDAETEENSELAICHTCLCDMKNATTEAGWGDKPIGHER